MGMVAILVMWPRPREQTFVPLSHWGSIFKFGFDWPSGFGEEDPWEWWTDERRTPDDGPWLHYKLINEPKGSGELKSYDDTTFEMQQVQWNMVGIESISCHIVTKYFVDAQDIYICMKKHVYYNNETISYIVDL